MGTCRSATLSFQPIYLMVDLMKTEFCHATVTVTFLGHMVGQGQVAPVTAKIAAISKFTIPASKRELMRFLGMVGYYTSLS